MPRDAAAIGGLGYFEMSDEEGVIKKRRVVQTVKWTTIGLVLICLLNLAYLPGPDFLFETGYAIWLVLLMLSLPSILVFLIGTIKVIANLVSRKQVSRVSLFSTLIPVFLLANLSLSQVYLDDIVTDYTIQESIPIINAIEKYKSDVGLYPKQLTGLVPEYLGEVPTPIAIGIKAFDYVEEDSTYELSFDIGYSMMSRRIVYDPLMVNPVREAPPGGLSRLPKGWVSLGLD